jgi:hypothetical protein
MASFLTGSNFSMSTPGCRPATRTTGVFGHDHLSFNKAEGRAKFEADINRFLERNGLAYELKVVRSRASRPLVSRNRWRWPVLNPAKTNSTDCDCSKPPAQAGRRRSETTVGNNFMIWHTEANKTPIDQSAHIDYLFERLFVIVRLSLKQTGRGV